MPQIKKFILFYLTAAALFCYNPVLAIDVPLPSKNTTVSDYISFFFKFALMAAGATAMAMLIYGGFLFITSGGGKKEKGKDFIYGALLGLVLILGSYLILNTINPELIQTDFNLGEGGW